MLVTSRDTGRWVPPKRWTKKELNCTQLAEKEAFEEAGIVAVIPRKKMVTYNYWKRLPNERGVTCAVDVFAMRVTELLDDWPEKTQRRRKWFFLSVLSKPKQCNKILVLLHPDLAGGVPRMIWLGWEAVSPVSGGTIRKGHFL